MGLIFVGISNLNTVLKLINGYNFRTTIFGREKHYTGFDVFFFFNEQSKRPGRRFKNFERPTFPSVEAPIERFRHN